MDKFYYLASQLPALLFAEPTYTTTQDFLAEARKWLDEKEFSLLSESNINNFSLRESLPRVLKQYRDFERNLREELMFWRKSLKNDSYHKLPEHLETIVTHGTPLDAEKKLLRLRWEFIEDLEKEHYFDFEFLVLYFLKLQILERLLSFNKEKGLEAFQKACEVKYG